MTAAYYDRHGVTVRAGDCLDRLAALPDGSVDAVVTDPPYGLSEVTPARLTTALTAWVNGDRDHVPDGKGFMGKSWDAFVPPPAVWDECLRVLKPGGHMLVFAGSRTVDLMGLSIRLAGFEIRDSLQWLNGAGFPKSLDVGKAIDKARDEDRAPRAAVCAWLADRADAAGVTRRDVDEHLGTSDMGGWWLSRLPHRCAIPTPEQWKRLRELIGFDDTMDAEVARLNGRKGTPGEAWLAAEVIGTEDRMNEPTGIVGIGQGERTAVTRQLKAPNTDAARRWSGFGTALKPAAEPIILARKPLDGTVARNVLAHGVGGINIDGCRVGDEIRVNAPAASLGNGVNMDGGRAQLGREATVTTGRFPANVVLTHNPDCDEQVCDAGCPVAELDAQSGTLTSGKMMPLRPAPSQRQTYGQDAAAGYTTMETYGDSGGASRFFPSFRWEPKVPTSERPQVAGVAHPTVKPVALMRWLVRLVTPPGGLVLDPFAGSGTTGHAARAEGVRALLIEQDPDYLSLIKARLDGRERTSAAEAAAVATGHGPVDLLDLLEAEEPA